MNKNKLDEKKFSQILMDMNYLSDDQISILVEEMYQFFRRKLPQNESKDRILHRSHQLSVLLRRKKPDEDNPVNNLWRFNTVPVVQQVPRRNRPAVRVDDGFVVPDFAAGTTDRNVEDGTAVRDQALTNAQNILNELFENEINPQAFPVGDDVNVPTAPPTADFRANPPANPTRRREQLQNVIEREHTATR